MKKILTVSVIGMGARGFLYAGLMKDRPDRYSVVAICDRIKERRKNAQKEFQIREDGIFEKEEDFFRQKRSDVLIVSTQDKDHVNHAIKGLKLGYDILMEKPIAVSESDCLRLDRAARIYRKKVVVCHVLRYAPAFVKLKELIESRIIGDLVFFEGTEQVQYLHYAHSYVRGNWRNDRQAAPMILAKCCHDLDLFQWFAHSKCESVSSFGSLSFFKKENQPKGATDRCCDCPHNSTCPYSAENIYIRNRFWGRNMVTDLRPVTDQNVSEALKKGPYGRCVFACDNNVVDHQIVHLQFQNGIRADLKMMAFTSGWGRNMNFYGTYGNIAFSEEKDTIEVMPFDREKINYRLSSLGDTSVGHGGGETRMIDRFYDMIQNDESDGYTTLEESLESHYIGFSAEKSRLKNGRPIKIRRNR